MIKRLHEYKRQSLKILAVIARYASLKSGETDVDTFTRVLSFSGKAAPGYAMAGRNDPAYQQCFPCYQ